MTCKAILWAWMGAGRGRAVLSGLQLWARRTDRDVVATIKETGLPAQHGLVRVHLLWHWCLHLHRVALVVVVVVVVDWGLGKGLHQHFNLLRGHRLRRVLLRLRLRLRRVLLRLRRVLLQLRRVLLLHVRLCHGHGCWDRRRHFHLKGLARRDPVWHHRLHLLPGAGILHHEGGSRSEARRARHRHRRRRPHLFALKQTVTQLLVHSCCCCARREMCTIVQD